MRSPAGRDADKRGDWLDALLGRVGDELCQPCTIRNRRMARHALASRSLSTNASRGRLMQSSVTSGSASSGRSARNVSSSADDSVCPSGEGP